MVDTVAIQDAMREKIARLIRDAEPPFGADESINASAVADAILSLPEIEAGLGLYLGSIEEREPS